MSKPFFAGIEPVQFRGPDADPLSYRYYDKDRLVLGKRMEDHLRAAVCYWHSFAWPGSDVFGAGTFDRPWFSGAPLEAALVKLDAAFEFFEKLGVPYFTFHDRDVSPEGATPAETTANLDRVIDAMQKKMDATGVKLLWGTANLFSHPRYMSGAATNPDPEVFAFAASQVKKAMDVTLKLDGANYVLWGGREGYETLLNTDLKRELDQLGRFLSLVAEYKHKIGFKGALLIEPKPKEPTKHQYDFDTATVYGFLQHYGLEKEYKVNIEANHAILSGHSFQHEVLFALTHGVFGSIDMNRGDYLLGWDTDQFHNDVNELALVLAAIIQGGGFTTGGMNFDAKLRRQSIDPADLFHGHIGGMDTMARGLLFAEKLINEKTIESHIAKRYAGWETPLGKDILAGRRSLEDLAALVAEKKFDPKPRSGQQELLENLVNRTF